MKGNNFSMRLLMAAFCVALLSSPLACMADLEPEAETDENVEVALQNSCFDGALVPAMTSNTAPFGAVTRSGVYSSTNEAWKAFDGTTSTIWLSNTNTDSVWIAYEWGGGTKVVSSYRLKYANGSCCEQRGPKNQPFQGVHRTPPPASTRAVET